MRTQPESALRSEPLTYPERPFLPALEGIRGLAVLMVLAIHYGDFSQSHLAILRILDDLKTAGWAGVDLFFVLSGFLITGILWDTRERPHRARNFYLRRALRLFPLFYGVWTALLLYLWFAHLPWASAYLAYLLYCGNIAAIFYPAVGPFLVAHFWSLAVEEQFYLLWPLLLWRLPSLRAAIRFLALAALASVLLKVLLLLAHVGNYWSYYLLPTHVEGLALGALLALTLRTPRGPAIAARAARYLPLSLAAVAIEVLLFHGLQHRNPVVVLFAVPTLSIAAALLIASALEPASRSQRAMQIPVLRFFGRYSYGLYVFHYLLRNVLRSALYVPLVAAIPNPAAAGLIYVAACMLLLTGLAMLSYHLYEMPFLKLKRRFAA